MRMRFVLLCCYSNEELTNVKLFGDAAQRLTVVNGQVFITWERGGTIKFWAKGKLLSQAECVVNLAFHKSILVSQILNYSNHGQSQNYNVKSQMSRSQNYSKSRFSFLGLCQKHKLHCLNFITCCFSYETCNVRLACEH